MGIRLAPIRELMIDKESQLAFVFLLFAVAFVLLIACTNVANLLLAKSSARQREMAIRSALGAGKWRIVRQLISESSVLALIGAGLGVLLAIWGLDILVASLPERVALNSDIHVSERSLIFTALASLVAALMFGLAPAFRASRVNLVDSLKEGMQSTSASSSRRRGRDLLVIGQIAMAMALVLCTGLMTKSFLNILDVPTHFNRDGLMTMTVDLPEYDYEEEHDLTAFYREATERLRAIPGVQSATASDGNPIGNMNRIELKVDGYEAPSDEIKIWTFTNYVETDYFETMQIPLIDGRFLSSLDGEDGQTVAIVSEVLATRFWPDESAIGKRFQLGTDETWLTIVGIVPSIRVSLIDPAPGLEVTIPISQSPTRQMTFYVRTDGDTQMLISPMKSAIGEIDVNLPVSNVLTLNQVIIDNIGAYGTLVGILITLAGIALLLSCVGLYGVIAYTVELRTRELGIRIALGAKAGDVLRLVLWRGVIITLIGVVIGLGLAAALAMLLKNVMFGVSPTDPTTYLQISAVLMLVAIVACYIPARRATKVDPMVALRYE
ncbi:MAG: FtsX-like permease family protein [Planctomycetes bacterium]|nr:FtsX-like permease family protein [Planctomycetota bacterium]